MLKAGSPGQQCSKVSIRDCGDHRRVGLLTELIHSFLLGSDESLSNRPYASVGIYTAVIKIPEQNKEQSVYFDSQHEGTVPHGEDGVEEECQEAGLLVSTTVRKQREMNAGAQPASSFWEV